MTVQQIIDEAKRLPAADRLRVVEALAETFDDSDWEASPEWLRAWMPEFDRRWQEYVDGKVQAIDGLASIDESTEMSRIR